MVAYTGRRFADMFEFFRGYINVHYLAEKLQNSDTGGRRTVQEYDEDQFKQWLFQDFGETSRELDHKVRPAGGRRSRSMYLTIGLTRTVPRLRPAIWLRSTEPSTHR